MRRGNVCSGGCQPAGAAAKRGKLQDELWGLCHWHTTIMHVHQSAPSER